MIQSGIVKIFAKNGTTSGTGFVAKADGLNSLIVTCAHVIQNGQHKPGDEITVVFHANNTEERLAVVEKEWWRDPEHEDIAVLRLKDELPINARSLLLGKAKANVSKQRGFVSFGYPDLGDVQESSIEGNIGALVENDTRLEINSPDIEHGASGAPVFDTIAKRVIGVIKGYPSHNRGKVAGTPSGRLKERNYAIPAEVLFEICPLLSPHYECPYQGLKPFNETTSQFFFGRKTIIEDALSKLNQKPPVLGIVGASGSGKSSLIRAGLFPALEKGKILNSQNWKWLTFRPAYPTFNPIDNLVRENERVLNSDDLSDIVTDFFANNPQTEHLIIFADQFEELFVRCTSEIREHFLNNLDRIRNNSKVTFIYAVRGDFFYDYIINNARLYEKGYRIDVGNVSETELRDIITEPAREASLFFVPDELPENIAKKASEAKNPLPLLQETLLQLYNQAKKRIELPELTSQAFDDIGGSVTGSIGRWAEQSYRELDRERQKLTKRIFLKLVDYEQERLFRRTRELSDLVANETERNVVYDVVNSWVKKRLLVIGENQDSIELVHDALIVRDKEKRVWNRLSGWIDEHKDFLMWRRGFEFDYNSYREKKGDLLSGNTLLEAERWLNQHREWLDLNEQLYIELSIGKREQELAVREAVRKRNFRWSIGAIVILAVLLIAAVSQWGRAENEVITRSTAQADAENARAVADTERIDAENARATADAERVEAENAREMAETRRQEAEEQRNIAESQRLSALAQLAINQSGTGYIRSGLLSIESLNLFSNSGSALTLQNSVKLFPSLLTQTSHSGVTGVIFSPDGKLIATWGADQIIQIWDVKSGKSVISLNHQLDIETASNYNPPEPSVERWSNYRNLIYDNLLTEDGNFLDTSQWTHSVNFSFDGKKLVSATGNDVKVWDIPTGNQVYQLPQQNDLVTKSFFSPDDELLVTVSNNKVKVWDANTGQPQTEIAHKKEVRDAEFSFDGKLLATAGLDGIVQIWNIENTDTFSLTHNSAIFDIDFSSDGKMLAAAGQDGVAHIWDITKSTEIQFPHDNPVISVKFWNDDKYLVTNVVLGTAIMWDIDAQALVKQIHNNTSVTTLDRVILDYYPYSAHANSGPLGSFSPFDITFLVRLSLDEKQIVTIGNDSTVRIWQADKNVNLIVNESRNNYASALINPLGQGVFVDANFSPDSGLIATASADGIIQLWQIKSDVGIVKAFVPPPKRGIKAISVSPDGRYLTIGEGTPTVQEKGEEVDRSGQVKIWDMYTQKEIVTIPHRFSVEEMTFSPDGRFLATDTFPHTIRIWAMNSEFQTPVTEIDEGGPIVFSPDSKYIVNWSGVWEVDTGNQIAELLSESISFVRIFSPDGEWLVEGNSFGSDGETGNLIIRATKNFEELKRIEYNEMGVDNVLFSPTGHRLIVVGSNEGSVYVYKTVNDDIGDKIAEIEQRTRTFNGSLKIAISSDSEILVIGANNGDIKVIDLITGLEKFQFFHSGGVRSLALSANGQWLVTGSRFNIDSPATVRIWETKTGRLLLEFEGSASEIVFGLDDKLLVTFDWGQNVNVQSWQLEDLIVETCTRIPRNFTTDEWKEYFGDKPYHRTCSNLSQPAK